VIVVLTCAREPSYAESTLRQIDESATGRRVLLVDGVDVLPPAGWTAMYHPRPCVPPQNKWTAWEAFKIADRVGEDLCFFEDDLEFSKNAPSFIEDFVVPDDLAFVTFFSPWIDRTWPIGLWRHHAHSYVMAQALKFSRQSVRELAACKEEAMSIAPGGFDEALHHAAITRRWRYGIVNPGLVQHVGSTSMVGNGPLQGMRVTKNFVGREFDANGLRRCPSEFFA
jgi:hypothetical protein